MSEFIIECEYDTDEGWIPGEHREEIVRCKECKHFDCFWTDCYVCKRNKENFMPFVEPDGFCAWGKRKVVE